MSTTRSWLKTLERIGRSGRRVDGWAAERSRGHHRRQLEDLGIFDGTIFGYRYRMGGLGRMAQYRRGWWPELLAAAGEAGTDRVVLRTDQVRWLVSELEREGSGRASPSDPQAPGIVR